MQGIEYILYQFGDLSAERNENYFRTLLPALNKQNVVPRRILPLERACMDRPNFPGIKGANWSYGALYFYGANIGY